MISVRMLLLLIFDRAFFSAACEALLLMLICALAARVGIPTSGEGFATVLAFAALWRAHGHSK